eukprot:9085-Pelagococcus_subviridis.AAC.4
MRAVPRAVHLAVVVYELRDLDLSRGASEAAHLASLVLLAAVDLRVLERELRFVKKVGEGGEGGQISRSFADLKKDARRGGPCQPYGGRPARGIDAIDARGGTARAHLHFRDHEIVLLVLARVRPQDELLDAVVLPARLDAIGKPLHGERRPLQRVRDDEIVQERRVLLPYLVLLGDEPLLELVGELIVFLAHRDRAVCVRARRDRSSDDASRREDDERERNRRRVQKPTRARVIGIDNVEIKRSLVVGRRRLAADPRPPIRRRRRRPPRPRAPSHPSAASAPTSPRRSRPALRSPLSSEGRSIQKMFIGQLKGDAIKC